jgi:AcrR family transcriptional regulator
MLILDAAQRLFAEHGYEATSLRAIIAAAGVNLAAVHYHFKSKEALLLAVAERGIEPINRERMRMLLCAEQEAGGGPPQVEELIRAFIAPAFRVATAPGEPLGSTVFMRLMGRLYSESPEAAKLVFRSQLGEVAQRFIKAFKRALPYLTHDELMWRLHFLIGAMAHTFRGADLTEAVTGDLWRPAEPDVVLERLIRFLAAGMKAEVG